MSHALRRTSLSRALVGVLALLCLVLPQNVANAGPHEPGKISAKARADLRDGKATLWIRLKGEADLGAASRATTKAAKTKAVYAAKTAYADRSQAGLRALLTRRHAEFTPFWIVNAVKVTADEKLAEEIAALPEVTALEPVAKIEKPKEPGPKPGKARSKATAGVEWNIDMVKAPQVWNDLHNRGEGIVIGVIDSGMEFTHPALIKSYRGTRADGFVDHNYNWFDAYGTCPSSAPCDMTGHGTHVTGIAAGADGIGVAPGAKWIGSNGCGDDCEEAESLAAAQWMIAPTDLNGQNPRPDLAPDVVNNSWGWRSTNPNGVDFRDAVDAWIAAGIFPIFANGNDGTLQPCGTSLHPGSYPGTYSVGALDSSGGVADLSSRGPGENGDVKPNVSAPGKEVRSSIPGEGYTTMDGTSQAAPHVAGAVALVLSAAPSLRKDVSAIRALFDDTAVDIPDTSCGGTADDNNVAGEGAMDVHATVLAAPDDPLGGLHGTVTANGQPVPDAEVRVTGPLGRTAAGGQDGAYSLPRLPPGGYQVTVSRFGYQDFTGTATVTDGQTTTLDVTLTPKPSGVVSGTVTVAGTPAKGATVTVAGTGTKAVADATGHYQLRLPYGSHRLRVGASRCDAPADEQITVAGDMTRNVGLQRRADAFGYTCAVGAEPYVAGTQPVALTDVFTTKQVALPFPVPFYGALRNEVRVAPVGFATFADTSFASSNNESLPNVNVPDLAVYPFWDDFVIGGATGVYTATVGTAPHRSFVIEWRDVVFRRTGMSISFSVLLGEDGTISYRYKDTGIELGQGGSATIGIENADGTDALLYSYNTSSLTDGRSLTFVAAGHGVVRGTVTDANDGQPVAGATVTFPYVATFTTGQDGTFSGQIRAGNHTAQVSGENYGTTTRQVTVVARDITTMDTELITGKVVAAPTQVSLTAPPGTTGTATVTLTNQGWPTPYDVIAESAQSGWLSVSPLTGGLLKNQSATLTVTVSTAGLAPGDTREGELVIHSTSARRPIVRVPVTLTVPE
ncbi:S8 family serine peptidase [Streptosporangium sp. NPDC001559]|uniref:S8 family serine peptidase n=1 Tax=Streptosporangium sp. NPDC001559 TaxID=3366187 RepID=UPI0036EF8A51